MRSALCAVLIGVSAVTPAAFAHHSISAMYDRDRSITIDGTVVAFEFIQPHPLIHVAVAGPGGSSVTWKIEWSSRTRLEARGYAADVLRPGDRVIVTGGPARDGTPGLFVGRLLKPEAGFEYVSSRQGGP